MRARPLPSHEGHVQGRGEVHEELGDEDEENDLEGHPRRNHQGSPARRREHEDEGRDLDQEL